MLCDHNNLEYLHMSNVLSLRPVRWAETHSSYDFVIQHLERKKNPADGPSRRPDWEERYKRSTTWLLATRAATTTIEPFNNRRPAIEAAHDTDPLSTDTMYNMGYPGLSKARGQDKSMIKDLDIQWKVIAGALTYRGKIYMLEALCNQAISLFHDKSESGHFGALRRAEFVSRDCYWLGLDAIVRKYIASCEVCHWIKAPCHAPYGANMPLPPL